MKRYIRTSTEIEPDIAKLRRVLISIEGNPDVALDCGEFLIWVKRLNKESCRAIKLLHSYVFTYPGHSKFRKLWASNGIHMTLQEIADIATSPYSTVNIADEYNTRMMENRHW